MFKYDSFKSMTVTSVAVALYVDPSPNPDAHTDRTYQGLIMNEPHGKRTYYFSDGRVMETEGNDIFFLPKGSTYRVEPTHNMEPDSGCYAINFEASISSPPFVIKPRDPDTELKLFDTAAKLWKAMDPTARNFAIKSIYDTILSLEKDSRRAYMPGARERLLSPAIETISNSYTDHELTVKKLASLCGVSEVYFRKLFYAKFGTSPKEYLIKLRIKYAKSLLRSGEFSISRVAEMCGYREACHFSREFSRLAGVSPSEYGSKQ